MAARLLAHRHSADRGCVQGADAILAACLDASLRVATTAIEAIAPRACRFRLEGGAMNVCSTKTRTAALSMRTRDTLDGPAAGA